VRVLVSEYTSSIENPWGNLIARGIAGNEPADQAFGLQIQGSAITGSAFNYLKNIDNLLYSGQ
jgi:hypothetical protein